MGETERTVKWVEIPGYYYRYRISELAEVQRLTSRGNWKTVAPDIKVPSNMVVRLYNKDRKRVPVRVLQLMRDAFMGGPRPGYRVAHRTSQVMDCSIYNLMWSTHSEIGRKNGGPNRRSVEKVAADGTVLEVYRSISEASKKNFVTRRAITDRCEGKTKAPFTTSGTTFRYEVVSRG